MRGMEPLPSLNVHQCAEEMAHAKVERCSCIMLHCWENHEILCFVVEIPLDPKLSLGAVLLLLCFADAFAASLLMQVLLYSTSLC